MINKATTEHCRWNKTIQNFTLSYLFFEKFSLRAVRLDVELRLKKNLKEIKISFFIVIHRVTPGSTGQRISR